MVGLMTKNVYLISTLLDLTVKLGPKPNHKLISGRPND